MGRGYSFGMATHPLSRLKDPRRRGLLARVLVGGWLLLQIGLVAAVPVVDARVGHADQVVAHWEDASDTSCPPLHDTAVCQLCQQVVAAARTTAHRPLLPVVARAAQVVPSGARQRALRPVAVATAPSRAPPVS